MFDPVRGVPRAGERISPSDVRALPAPRVQGGGDRANRETPRPGVNQFDHMDVSTLPYRAYAKMMIDGRSRVTSVRIVNADTDGLIREIPSADMLELARQVEAYLRVSEKRGR